MQYIVINHISSQCNLQYSNVRTLLFSRVKPAIEKIAQDCRANMAATRLPKMAAAIVLMVTSWPLMACHVKVRRRPYCRL